MSTSTPYTFDRVVRIIIGVLVLVLLFFLFRKLSAVLFPFAVAWLIAYLLQPLVRFFQYKLKLKNRILSVACSLLFFSGVVVGLIALLLPLVSKELMDFYHLVSVYMQTVSVDAFLPVAWQVEIQNYLTQFDLNTFLVNDVFLSEIKEIIPQLWGIASGVLNLILGLAVIIVIVLYVLFILIDFERISAGLIEIIPPKYRTLVSEVVGDLEDGLNRYFRGQALIALIVGVLFIIGFLIIQLPMAIVLGVLIGVLSFIPYLKAIALIPSVFMALLQSAETGQSFFSIMIGVIAVYIIIQIFEDLILIPKIMGKVTGLNPAVILLSLSIWGSLIGMVGLIIALPMTLLVISYYKRFVLEGKPLLREHDETNKIDNK
jgi:predicted PurR-regulated permease PerM